MSIRARFCLSALALLALAAPAHAELVSASGPAFLSPLTGQDPLDLRRNRTQSGLVGGYDEGQQRVVVADNTICVDVLVDASTIGQVFTGNTNPPAGVCPAWLPAGTYDSHLLHLDPAVGGTYTLTGASFTFDGEIAALIVTQSGLLQSDIPFGHAPTWIYSRNELFASRSTEVVDSFYVSAENAFRINVFQIAPGTMDELRVLTIAPDTDGDGVIDREDLCPLDVYDDSDGDTLCDSDDICPLDFDNDIDGDTVCGDEDNCPDDPNEDQYDFDADTFGDVCDEDDDGDDVDDIDDACAETEAGAAADEVGCSLDQECPCDGGWRNHGAYVSCVSHATRDLVWLEVMTSDERSDIVSEAGQSSCGH